MAHSVYRIDEIEPAFDQFDIPTHAVKTARDGAILLFEEAKTLLDLDHILAEVIHPLIDTSQVD